MINREKVLFREYSVPQQQSAEQVLTYYSQITLEQIGLEKLPLFNDLAPKIQDFVKRRLFGGEVDLDDVQTVAALKTKLAMEVTVGTFLTALKPLLVEETDSQLVQVASRRKLSAVAPYAWGRQHRCAELGQQQGGDGSALVAAAVAVGHGSIAEGVHLVRRLAALSLERAMFCTKRQQLQQAGVDLVGSLAASCGLVADGWRAARLG